MDSSNRLAVGLFSAFVAVVLVFLIAPSVTATLTANQANPAPATGYVVLIAVWVFPVVLIASVVGYYAFKAIRRTQ